MYQSFLYCILHHHDFSTTYEREIGIKLNLLGDQREEERGSPQL